MKRLKHENVVNLFEVIDDADHVCPLFHFIVPTGQLLVRLGSSNHASEL